MAQVWRNQPGQHQNESSTRFWPPEKVAIKRARPSDHKLVYEVTRRFVELWEHPIFFADYLAAETGRDTEDQSLWAVGAVQRGRGATSLPWPISISLFHLSTHIHVKESWRREDERAPCVILLSPYFSGLSSTGLPRRPPTEGVREQTLTSPHSASSASLFHPPIVLKVSVYQKHICNSKTSESKRTGIINTSLHKTEHFWTQLLYGVVARANDRRLQVVGSTLVRYFCTQPLKIER